MNPRRALVATLALLANSARAQDIGTEVGSATVWFALLVVLFALLVSVGLFMARDQDDDEKLGDAAAPPPTARRRSVPRAPSQRQRHVHARRKQQQEFT